MMDNYIFRFDVAHPTTSPSLEIALENHNRYELLKEARRDVYGATNPTEGYIEEYRRSSDLHILPQVTKRSPHGVHDDGSLIEIEPDGNRVITLVDSESDDTNRVVNQHREPQKITANVGGRESNHGDSDIASIFASIAPTHHDHAPVTSFNPSIIIDGLDAEEDKEPVISNDIPTTDLDTLFMELVALPDKPYQRPEKQNGLRSKLMNIGKSALSLAKRGKEKLISRPVVSALAVGSVAVVAFVGSIAPNDSQQPETATSNATIELTSDINETTAVQEEVVILSPEQQAAYNEMLAWAEANPKLDFSKEYQQAQSTGYFDS